MTSIARRSVQGKTASRRLGNDFVFDRVSRVWDTNLRGRKQYGEVLE